MELDGVLAHPELLSDLAVGEPGRHRLEHAELSLGESLEPLFALGLVHPRREKHGALDRLPQRRPQVSGVNRLRDEGVGAAPEGHSDRSFVRECRHHDNLRLGKVPAGALGTGEPVHRPWHVHVDQGDIRIRPRHERECLATGARLGDDVDPVLVGQIALHRLHGQAMVVRNQYAYSHLSAVPLSVICVVPARIPAHSPP